jgi:hypothetical protein
VTNLYLKMRFFSGWLLSLSLISIQYLYIKGLTFSVSNYGAYPDDNLDDTHGIQ